MSRATPLLGLLPCLFLSGCIGATVFFEQDECLTAPFPDLHSVPDKPPCPDVQKYKQVENALSSSQEQAIMQNKQLREQFKLETNVTGS
jgi:hypothetical protein